MQPLISPAELDAIRSEPDVRIFDTTVHLRPDPPNSYRIESGLADYRAAHIPGAAFVDLQADFSRADTRLRFMLPDSGTLAAALGRAGIGNDHRIVLYASNHPMWATRLWWMLGSMGHRSVAVLDGGLRGWQATGLPVRNGDERYPAASFEGRIDLDWWADKDQVTAAINDGSTCTLNALPSAVHAGTAPISYGRKGHIKGSVNVPYEQLLDDDLRFREPDALRQALGTRVADGQPVIAYCGGGISATIDAFALRLIGHQRVRVYDGSMSEWASDPDAPMQTGSD